MIHSEMLNKYELLEISFIVFVQFTESFHNELHIKEISAIETREGFVHKTTASIIHQLNQNKRIFEQLLHCSNVEVLKLLQCIMPAVFNPILRKLCSFVHNVTLSSMHI